MDLQGILSNLLGTGISSKIVRTPDGTTYGPAVSLVSRTPIEFGTLPKNRNGEYYPDTKSIKIDPTKGNVPRYTRHEEIHALLDRLPMSAAPQTTSAPDFMNIARTLQPMVQGEMENEVPAYMGQQPTSGFYGISDNQRNDYMRGLVDQLQKLDPTIAQRIQRLSSRGN